jgi:serine/threonine protein kinase
LIERIGEGGMAEVFTAVLSGAEGFERLVVIKRLKPHLALNPDAVAQFIDEAKLGSVLAHSNIVTVSDFGKVGEGYYLARNSSTAALWRRSPRAIARSTTARCPPRLSSTSSTRCWSESDTPTTAWTPRDGRWGSSTATSRPATS